MDNYLKLITMLEKSINKIKGDIENEEAKLTAKCQEINSLSSQKMMFNTNLTARKQGDWLMFLIRIYSFLIIEVRCIPKIVFSYSTCSDNLKKILVASFLNATCLDSVLINNTSLYKRISNGQLLFLNATYEKHSFSLIILFIIMHLV